MSTVNVTISVPGPTAEVLRAAAAAAGQSLSGFTTRAAMDAAIRHSCARHTAWRTEHPDQAARQDKQALLDELEREAASLAEEL